MTGVATSLNALRLQVDVHNVLDVRKALLAEADRLATDLKWYERDSLVRKCGGDPVSFEAATAFNHKIAGFWGEFRLRIQALRDAAEVLADSARSYGHTEVATTASFTSRYTDDDIWIRA